MNDTPAAPAAPQFISRSARGKTIDLEWPLEFEGVEYHAIEVRRLTFGEVEAWQKSIANLPDDAPVVIPIYFRPDGVRVPDTVMRALDDDDKARLDKAALDFMPRRFRAAPASDTAPADGGSTEP